MEGLQQNLERAMRDYRCSPAFERTRSCFVKHFYQEGAARCSSFEEMTLDEVLNLGCDDLCSMPAVGRRKIEALVQIFDSLTTNYAERLVSVNNSDSKAAGRKDRRHQEHGSSFIDDFLAAIEQNTEDTDLILQGIRAALRKDSLEFAQSPILTELDLLLKTLRESRLPEHTTEHCIKDYWPEDHVRSSVLEEFSLDELAQESAISLLTRKGVGLKKLQSLCLALSRFFNRGLSTQSYSQPESRADQRQGRAIDLVAIREVPGNFNELCLQIRNPGLRVFAEELRRVLKEQELKELFFDASQPAQSTGEVLFRAQALVRGLIRKHNFDYAERWELLLHELQADEEQLLADFEPDTGYTGFEKSISIICIRALISGIKKPLSSGSENSRIQVSR